MNLQRLRWSPCRGCGAGQASSSLVHAPPMCSETCPCPVQLPLPNEQSPALWRRSPLLASPGRSCPLARQSARKESTPDEAIAATGANTKHTSLSNSLYRTDFRAHTHRITQKTLPSRVPLAYPHPSCLVLHFSCLFFFFFFFFFSFFSCDTLT